MTAETETAPFPLHPECEATLAADPGRTYLWDLTRPVRPPTPEEVAEYGRRHTDPGWHGLYRFAGYTGHADIAAPVAEPEPGEDAAETNWRLTVITPPPVAEPVPAENDGLRLTESGHEDPSAASEGAAADADLPRPGRADALGREEGTLAGPGQPDQTAVIPAVEAATEMFPAVEGTEGGAGS